VRLSAASLLAAVAVTLGQASPAVAGSGRIAIGLDASADPEAVAALVALHTGSDVDRTLESIGAFVVHVSELESELESLAEIPGVEYVERIRPLRRLAFQPNDPLALNFQWYLYAVHAFDFWEVRPTLPPVRVAVIDSGIDAGHPEFQGRIAASATFVKGRATIDTVGHGTFVAGEIAATLDNAEGIAGIGFPVELLIAKVSSPNGSIDLEAEVRAIRWAVDNDAQVINLSLGGCEYDRLEQDAINYAYGSGVVVVASVGNVDEGEDCRKAEYPAALPHVIGVGAVANDSSVPGFSRRDPIYNDLVAPGVGIISTFPSALTLGPDRCVFPGYSQCARDGAAPGNGTSFAAPIVSAAAALLISQRPELTPSQVMALLELSAIDLAKAGRDPATGNGLLDITAALSAAMTLAPPADAHEPNDDAGDDAHTLRSRAPRVDATIDFYDDPSDVYRVYLRAGHRVTASLSGPPDAKSTLVLWRPGTKSVVPITKVAIRSGAVLAYRTATDPRLIHRVGRNGWYYVEVKAPKNGRGAYRLTIRK
jgi:subtilisin family serine protease